MSLPPSSTHYWWPAQQHSSRPSSSSSACLQRYCICSGTKAIDWLIERGGCKASRGYNDQAQPYSQAITQSHRALHTVVSERAGSGLSCLGS